MANPRRNSYANNQSSDSPIFQNPSSHADSTSSRIIHFLKKPHAFPFLLTIFLFLTWLSLKLQHSSHYFSPPFSRSQQALFTHHTLEDDAKVNLVRFSFGFPSPLTKDNKGWILNPIALALRSNLLGNAKVPIAMDDSPLLPLALGLAHYHAKAILKLGSTHRESPHRLMDDVRLRYFLRTSDLMIRARYGISREGELIIPDAIWHKVIGPP
ncbi:hypothetical protein FCV25MIE_15177 [Fagus crenata]